MPASKATGIGSSAPGDYNAVVKAIGKPQNLPDFNSLSVIAATLLLAYALARFTDYPSRNLAIQLPGLFLNVQINLRTFVAVLVASLAAAGISWLIRDHPNLGSRSRLEYQLIPTLTAWVIGVPLFQLPMGLLWWVGFGLGGLILMLVLIAEYIVVDDNDLRQPLASAGLTVVSFSLYLILAASLRYANLRLYLILPALTLTAWLISLRTLHLRLHGRWALVHAGVVALLVGQLVAALHYWPLSPVAYGLVLLGAVYSLTNLMGSLLNGNPLRQALVEPGLVLAIFWIAAIFLR